MRHEKNKDNDRSPAEGDATRPDSFSPNGEILPWDGGTMAGNMGDTATGAPGQARRDADITVRLPPAGTPPDRRDGPKVVKVRRSMLIWLVCLLLLAAVAIAGLVRYLPARTTAAAAAKASSLATASTAASASTQASATPAASATAASSGAASPAASSGASPAASGGASPGASTPSAQPGAIAAGGGGVGAPIADLSALTPVTTSDITNPTTGPQQIGATTYEDSVRFTCYGGGGDIVYDVAGYKFLTALVGIPSDASNAVGNAMTITFNKDGSANQLSTPVTISLDHPQSIHLNLQGSSQLEVACSAINTTSQNQQSMDVAFGNATLGPS
jgi:hypothetical protein